LNFYIADFSGDIPVGICVGENDSKLNVSLSVVNQLIKARSRLRVMEQAACYKVQIIGAPVEVGLDFLVDNFEAKGLRY